MGTSGGTRSGIGVGEPGGGVVIERDHLLAAAWTAVEVKTPVVHVVDVDSFRSIRTTRLARGVARRSSYVAVSASASRPVAVADVFQQRVTEAAEVSVSAAFR